MSSIKNFNCTEENNQKTNETHEEKLKQYTADYSDLVNLFLSKYGSLDEDELISEMFKLINQKKQEGTYDAQQIKNLARKVEPFLNEEQKLKMEELFKLL